jgi:hypothetical protein
MGKGKFNFASCPAQGFTVVALSPRSFFATEARKATEKSKQNPFNVQFHLPEIQDEPYFAAGAF